MMGVCEGDYGEIGVEDGGDGMGDEDGGRAEARRRDVSRRGGRARWWFECVWFV